MKKILLTLLILAQLVVVAETKKGKAPVSQPKSAATSQPAKTEVVGKDGIKRFATLKEAAEDYAKALQEISNYGSRELLQTINPNVDKYVSEKLTDKDFKLSLEDYIIDIIIEPFEESDITFDYYLDIIKYQKIIKQIYEMNIGEIVDELDEYVR